MKILMILVLAGYGLSKAETVNGCVACHTTLTDSSLSNPAIAISGDIHTHRGLDCTACHGGSAEELTKEAAKASSTGYRGKPDATEIPAFCGNCHSDPEYMHQADPNTRVDQETLYWTSIHGKQLKKGDNKVATCISCHGVHGILAVDNPRSSVYPPNVVETCTACHADEDYMSGYMILDSDPDGGDMIPIPTDQGTAYMASVHANGLYNKNDLSTPTCNSCHGNHGAVPPGVSKVSAVCKQCHITQAGIFDSSPHREAFSDAEYPQCVACHGNHEIRYPVDDMIGISDDAFCLRCHYEGDEQLVIADSIHSMLTTLSTTIDTAEGILTRAHIAGMDIAEGQIILREAISGLVQSRNMVHSVSQERVAEFYTPAQEQAESVIDIGRGLLEELVARKTWLVIALVLIGAFALLLILKIRQVDKHEPIRREN